MNRSDERAQSAYTQDELERYLGSLLLATSGLNTHERAGARRALAAVRAGIVEYGLNSYSASALRKSTLERKRFGDIVIERNIARLEAVGESLNLERLAALTGVEA